MGDHHNHEHGEDSFCQTMERFNSTELIVREDIIAKAKDLAELISTSDDVQFYRRAESQIQNNEHVQKLISHIKKKQKEIVAFETTFKNKDMVQKIESEIAVLQDELDSVPIVSQFQQSQNDINHLLQLVMGIVRDTVSEKIDVEGSSPDIDPENCSD
jgi:cell fate (sporulation/competence/biofilm development) regulator YmcA (YheA/YmcA/DUF963 family)